MLSTLCLYVCTERDRDTETEMEEAVSWWTNTIIYSELLFLKDSKSTTNITFRLHFYLFLSLSFSSSFVPAWLHQAHSLAHTGPWGVTGEGGIPAGTSNLSALELKMERLELEVEPSQPPCLFHAVLLWVLGLHGHPWILLSLSQPRHQRSSHHMPCMVSVSCSIAFSGSHVSEQLMLTVGSQIWTSSGARAVFSGSTAYLPCTYGPLFKECLVDFVLNKNLL